MWKQIENTDYEVSSEGEVRKGERILPKHKAGKGYFQVHLGGSKGKKHRIHRLVAQSFLPNPEDKPCVDHINRIVTDNHVDNLRWCTKSENSFNVQMKEHSSKYKGVHYDKVNKKWRAGVRFNNKRKNLGRFDTEEEAGIAYDNFIIQNIKDFGILNFPERLTQQKS